MSLSWTPESALDERAWTYEYMANILKNPLPPRTQMFGNTMVHWVELDPGVVHVAAEGGTAGDRYITEQMVMADLATRGYQRAEFTFDHEARTATWDDIEEKAKRLIDSGQVTLLRNGYNNIAAHVVGDHGEYDSEIGRDDPNSRAITTWQCTCPWDQFAWQRTRKWKKYEGRPCAHVLATFWQAQSTPLDEQLEPGQTPTPGQAGPLPEAPGPGQQMQLPFPEQPAQPQPMPTQPAAPDVIPPFPGQQMEILPPGQLQPGQQGITVSVPGARQQTPFNPIQNPSTLSKVATEFNNSDMVRLDEEEYGIAEGKSPAHGAGSYKLIPANSIGEVLGQDPTTGWVDVIFAGPQADAGPMEPYHVRAWVEPSKLTPMPGVAKPGPFVRRR